MPAVLVHGVPDTHRLWDEVRRHLSPIDLVTPDLPGFGAELPARFNATKNEYVDWLIQKLEAIGEPVDLVGHDWGSIFVLRIVSTRPELVRTWAAGGGSIDRNLVWHDLAQMWQTPGVGEQVMDTLTGEALIGALAQQLGREKAISVAEHVDSSMKDCILKLYRSAASGFAEWDDAIDTISRPGIVFWGVDDPYGTPQLAERLAQRTRAKLVMFADGGHWWPVTRPADVARALQELWLRSFPAPIAHQNIRPGENL